MNVTGRSGRFVVGSVSSSTYKHLKQICSSQLFALSISSICSLSLSVKYMSVKYIHMSLYISFWQILSVLHDIPFLSLLLSNCFFFLSSQTYFFSSRFSLLIFFATAASNADGRRADNFEVTFSMDNSVSIPPTTLPKIVCFLSKYAQGRKVMKLEDNNSPNFQLFILFFRDV